ncbi:NAD(P)-binding protein [Cylindrobasidium torrendii FP15055 ss-10]|uniref:NAD(P)-binding protein n=1 Tax=Cylindrobasidium torrendii FP15055 ss-10 TaxID=1314674 RepID=A0A0D7B9M6_9AGAR|nr:NAD(P)-binding protein [Cylindrobasidium torrendii FP15055 ss-10]
MSSTSYPLEDQIALVTGGGTGIGNMIATALASAGAKVYIAAPWLDVLEKAASDASSIPGPGCLVPMQMNVVKEEDIEAAALTVAQNDRMLNILVNNAGVNGPIHDIESFLAGKMASENVFELEKMDDWVDIFKLNTIAPFFLVKAFTDLLCVGAAHTGGTSSVLNVSSCSALTQYTPKATSFAYGPSKTAACRVTTALAAHFAARGDPIRVNAIMPGVFPTAMLERASGGDVDLLTKHAAPGYLNAVPAKRAGRTDEMGKTALYLSTNDYVTGAILTIDGGLSLVNP